MELSNEMKIEEMQSEKSGICSQKSESSILAVLDENALDTERAARNRKHEPHPVDSIISSNNISVGIGTSTAIGRADVIYQENIAATRGKAFDIVRDRYSLMAPSWLSPREYIKKLNESEAKYWSKDRKLVQLLIWNLSNRISKVQDTDLGSSDNNVVALLERCRSKLVSDPFNVNIAMIASLTTPTNLKPRLSNPTNEFLKRIELEIAKSRKCLESDKQDFLKLISHYENNRYYVANERTDVAEFTENLCAYESRMVQLLANILDKICAIDRRFFRNEEKENIFMY